MDTFEKGEEIKFEDGSSYVVVDSFMLDGKQYLYVISDDGKNTTAIYRHENGIVSKLENGNEFDKVFKELVNRNKDEIAKYLEEFNEN